MTTNFTRRAGLIGALVMVTGCGQRQSGTASTAPASTAPTPAAAQENTSDTGRRLEADDPQAGLNTSRPDALKDIKPEPGTPAVP